MDLNYDKYTDEEIVKLVIQNQDDFVEIVRRYQTKLLYYILRISNVDKETAEDILQDVFLKVYKNINNFKPSLKFSSWIYRITHNYVIDHHRKEKRGLDIVDIEDDDLFLFLIDPNNIEEGLDKKILGEKIHEILNKLDFKYREVLILYFLEEKKYKEISDIIKKPINTVSTLLNRAKIQFKSLAQESELKDLVKNLN
ncbi:MAG: RNA polymerase sigma factor [Candidatus Gracilibacteria bacterium]